MPRSWELTTVVESKPGNGAALRMPLSRRVFLWGQDLPALSRYAGHATLILVLLLVTGNLFPQGIRLPSLGQLALPKPVPMILQQTEAPVWPGVTQDEHYLAYSTAPITVRVIRSILPMAASEPQRAVRTAILTYQVQGGDTVLGIAERFGLRGDTILAANDKLENNPDMLQVGQELNILPIDGAYHTVVKGETLDKIAKMYKVDPSVITSYGGNQLAEPYAVQPGQKLIIPGGIKPEVIKPVQVPVASYKGRAPADGEKGTGHFAWPMSGSISQRYWNGHRAIDIAAPIGTPIGAADGGVVVLLEVSTKGYGKTLIIDHGNGFQTRYAHLNAFAVEGGQSVTRGQVIGYCGRTGRSTGPHLHFEVIKSGGLYNPLNYLP